MTFDERVNRKSRVSLWFEESQKTSSICWLHGFLEFRILQIVSVSHNLSFWFQNFLGFVIFFLIQGLVRPFPTSTSNYVWRKFGTRLDTKSSRWWKNSAALTTKVWYVRFFSFYACGYWHCTTLNYTVWIPHKGSKLKHVQYKYKIFNIYLLQKTDLKFLKMAVRFRCEENAFCKSHNLMRAALTRENQD